MRFPAVNPRVPGSAKSRRYGPGTRVGRAARDVCSRDAGAAASTSVLPETAMSGPRAAGAARRTAPPPDRATGGVPAAGAADGGEAATGTAEGMVAGGGVAVGMGPGSGPGPSAVQHLFGGHSPPPVVSLRR